MDPIRRMNELVFKYAYDPSYFDPEAVRDDFGRLSIEVVTERFSGQGGFWVQWQDLREFRNSLTVFPIDPAAPPSAEWGLGAGPNYKLILGVKIAPANATGDLLVSVEINDESPNDNRVRASFLTNYPDLEKFSKSLASHMDGKVDQAVLTGR
jgi:hypothetical protein